MHRRKSSTGSLVSFKSTPPIFTAQTRSSRGFQRLRSSFNRTLVFHIGKSSGQDEDASLVVYCRGTKPGEKTLPEKGVTAEASNPRDDIAGCVLADLQFPDFELSARQL